MKLKHSKPRIAWEDRFQAPKLEELLNNLAKHQSQLVEQAREGIFALGGITESISWLGIPWRWTMGYGHEGTHDRPWAYIVPQPTKAVFALPMTSDAVATLPMRRLPKFIRDVVVFSPKVAGVHWMQWDLSSRAQVEELISLAKRKHEFLLSPSV
jgi:hypothetical protein